MFMLNKISESESESEFGFMLKINNKFTVWSYKVYLFTV